MTTAPRKSGRENTVYFLSACGTVMVLLLTALNLSLGQGRTKVVVDNSGSNAELEFWREFLRDNPRYYDGYKELAWLEQERGNETAATQVLGAADEMFPNEKAVELNYSPLEASWLDSSDSD